PRPSLPWHAGFWPVDPSRRADGHCVPEPGGPGLSPRPPAEGFSEAPLLFPSRSLPSGSPSACVGTILAISNRVWSAEGEPKVAHCSVSSQENAALVPPRARLPAKRIGNLGCHW